MKTKFLLSTVLLCFVITAKAQVYNGNLDFTTQTQIDNFNYTEINGNLEIYVDDPANGCTDCITNFNHMNMLTKINGWFIISNATNNPAMNLQGFSNLSYVRVINFSAGMCCNVKFEGLTSINRIDTLAFEFYGNNTVSFDGLQNLKSIGFFYSAIPADSTEYPRNFSFEGLNNVETIHHFEYSGKPFKAKGLDNLKQITDKFSIGSQGGLGSNFNYNTIDFRGMNNLNYINNFWIRDDYYLDSLTFNGLEAVRRIDTLEIGLESSTNPINMQALSGVTSMQKLILERGAMDCGRLNLDNFSNITTLKDLVINNTAVENLNGLRNLQLITGNLSITYNRNLSNCCAIKDLLSSGSVKGSININNNGRNNCFQPYPYTLECDNIDSIFATTCDIHSDSINLVEAKLYIDKNSNSIFDNNDIPVPYKNIKMNYPSGTTYTNITDNTGKAKFYINKGNFQFTSTSEIANYTVTPAIASKTFTSLSNLDSVQFIATPITSINDMSVEIIIGGITRAGRENNLLIHIANIGTQTSNGTLKFKIDNRATVLSTNPAFSSTIGDTLVWNISNLLQLNHQNISVQYMPDSFGITNVDTLYHFAKIVNSVSDATPPNNSYVAPDPVRGSYDPNDKSVSNQFITPGMIANGNYLTYTIRFQNTGNDTAFRVEIKDTLSDNLDWNSIEMIGASHPYMFKQENGKYVTFTFNNILLPDSNVNEIKSHGFVSFKIKPKSTLPLGAAIPNTGYIYFDLNTPVKTNTVQTTVQLLSNTITNKQFDGKLSVYPNPNNGEFILQLNSKQTGNLLINITNLSGQIVYSSKENHTGSSTFTINSNNLEAGVYLVTVQLNNETTSQKFVVIK